MLIFAGTLRIGSESDLNPTVSAGLLPQSSVKTLRITRQLVVKLESMVRHVQYTVRNYTILPAALLRNI